MIAAHVLLEVLKEGRSLTRALEFHKSRLSSGADRALVQSLSFGTLRWYYRLDYVLRQLLEKPLKTKDIDIRVLALLGLYQIGYTRVKTHAAVSETVAAAGRKTWAKPLLNAVLRSYLRKQEEVDRLADQEASSRTAHPEWLLRELGRSWPEHAEAICAANNCLPPMVLRVNRTRCGRDQYLQMLKAQDFRAEPFEFCAQGIRLEKPVDVEKLPGFFEGLVSVQDGAAQLAAGLLEAQSQHRVLDACAAPGGKTAHLLEGGARFQKMIAVDMDSERALAISGNLARLGLQASVWTGDFKDFSADSEPGMFDRILLDVPCSATGVIRRHPDIKLLRRREDIENLVETQRTLLDAAWVLLAPGGILVYSTCSILRQENDEQIEGFMKRHPEAREMPIDAQWGIRCRFGRQIFPGEKDMDGFYYARLQRLS